MSCMLHSAAMTYFMTLLKDKTRDYTEPRQTILGNTPWKNVSIYAPVDKLPHANQAPVIFTGDSCHPMVLFSGMTEMQHGN